MIKDFEAQYGVDIHLSTFNDTDEALTKIASAASSPYDIYFPSYDQIGKMVTAKLIRPLNHDYFPNIATCGRPTRPLVRPGLALHGPLHRLHAPGSAGGPTRCPTTSPA